MKQRYPRLPLSAAVVILILYLPRPALSQCLCSDGTPALTQEQVTTATFPSNSTRTISVPRFDPATGTLVCVNAKVYLTSVLRLHMENDENFRVTKYIVHYDRFDSLSGPGISPVVAGSFNKEYGPFDLEANDGAFQTGPDHVFIGPDTVYNNKIYEANTADVTGYLGSGNVDFFYKSKVNTYATGGDLYNLAVNGQNRMQFRMTYSYCNTQVLPLNLLNFSAVMDSRNNVNLSWSVSSESKTNSYEIQLSENGSQFKAIGATPAKPVNGAPAEYHYQYHADQPAGGKLYFRIRQSDGKTARFSGIRIVHPPGSGVRGLRLYPNPATNYFNLEFEEPVNGDLDLELRNTSGSLLYARKIRMNNSMTLQLPVKDPPPPGVYFLLARDVATGKTYGGKLFFRR